MTDKSILSSKNLPRKTLQTASDFNAILTIVSGEVWAKTREGVCPAHRVPKPERLIFDELENYQEAWREVGELIRPLFPPLSMRMDSVEIMLLIFVEARSFGRPSRIDSVLKMTLAPEWIELIHRRWREADQKADSEGKGWPKHPLGPLMRAWLEHVKNDVVANLERDDRILPSRCAMVPHDHVKAGTLFAHAAHFEVRGEAQAVLPGFETQRSQPALPLELYDLSGGPSNTQGRGAPLALRLLVESILAVGLQDRGRGFPVVLRITLRDFLARLYPRKIPDRRIYWPRLWRASEALDRAWIPWLDPTTKKGGIGRFVLVSNLPRNPGAMDDEIKIIVDLPPGVGAGPMVSPRLALWGLDSAPAYRGLLNLAFMWFQPGKTRTPVRGKKHWIQSSSPDRYEKVTDDLLIQTFYPTSSSKDRRGLLRDAKVALAKLEKAGELRMMKDRHGIHRLMPPAWMYGQDPDPD